MDVEGAAEEARTNLAQTLLSESEAYGYTLTIWGSTTLLVQRFDIPSSPQVFGFVAGALVAFAVLASVAFEQFLAYPDRPEGEETKFVVSMVHFLAAFGNLFVVESAIAAIRGVLPPTALFVLVGFQTTLVYNVLLLVEHVLPQRFQ
jgi:hypothetical protein